MLLDSTRCWLLLLTCPAMATESLKVETKLLDPAEMSYSSLRERASQLMTSSRSGPAVHKVVFATTPADISLLLGAKPIDADYYGIQLGRTVANTLRGSVAEFIRIKDAGHLRVRSNGGLATEVIGASDPLTLEITEERYTIEGVAFTDAPCGRETLSTGFFVTTKQVLSVTRGMRVLSALRSRGVGRACISVILRNDPWFIQEDGFPIPNPFSLLTSPPPKEVYRSSPQVYCAGDATGRTKCVSKN